MYVKSLTLRGFKSFAGATTLHLEPGITAIVGPNGSGKSNVVDALMWVMGEQGAKSLRGSSMQDVIFAGTPGKAALGRSEVSMTIDNTDGSLPIDYTEVTISRTMFRNGGSDYAINGTSCRLLDIQELLSDSGIGREMHVVVGQGQLDAVLRATAEERRSFIEEAAGILKHRKRREKALRKLKRMEGNLSRLGDLVLEVRRQLGPLGRQAKTARAAATIAADVRDARSRILAADIALLQAQHTDAAAAADQQTANARSLQKEISAANETLTQLTTASALTGPQTDRLESLWFTSESLIERFTATAKLAQERARTLMAAATATPSGPDPAQLRTEAARMEAELETLHKKAATATTALATAGAEVAAAEQAYQQEQQRILKVAQAAADHREGLAKLSGQVSARQSRVDAETAELGRLQAGINTERIEIATSAAAAITQQAEEVETELAKLQAAAETANQEAEILKAAREQAVTAEQEAGKEVAALQARIEVLTMSRVLADGAQVLLESESPGVIGEMASLLQVQPGHEVVIGRALDWIGGAIAVDTTMHAQEAVARLRAGEHGRVDIVLRDHPTCAPAPASQRPDLPPGCHWVSDLVSVPPEYSQALHEAAGRLATAPDAESAAQVAALGFQAVTAEGDFYAPGIVRSAGHAGTSLLEVQAALERASDELALAQRVLGDCQTSSTQALRQAEQADELAAGARHKVAETQRKFSRLRHELQLKQQVIATATAEHDRLRGLIDQATVAIAATTAELQSLQSRLEQAEELPASTVVTEDGRSVLAEVLRGKRETETEARLVLRSLQEQIRVLGARVQSRQAAARAEEAARNQAAVEAHRQQQQAGVARAVAVACEVAAQRAQSLQPLLELQRAAARKARDEHAHQLRDLHQQVAVLTASLQEANLGLQERQRDLTQVQMRLEAAQRESVEDLAVSPEELVEQYGPHVLVPVAEDDGPGVPFVREEQERRLRGAQRKLSSLGRVNPLALEEFSALEERHEYLTGQLQDLESSQQDVLQIVEQIDQRIEQVFAEAFADTAAEFSQVFSRLFPGGAGKLSLTEPSNMMSTGIEIEARPPGKNIKRLSLLSGGERSLVAVALLVAIFKARPSPFYILDEVEAALDDANLGRLLQLLAELRDSSQLIVITHQKRTMEVADALYGVAMQGDGVTTLVSQRLRSE